MTKMMLINCNVSSISEVTAILDSERINFYQIIDRVTVKLPVGNPRLNTSIWPGYSVAIIVQCNPACCQDLKSSLTMLNEHNISEDETVFYSSWNLDE